MRTYGDLKSDVNKYLAGQVDTSTIPLLISLAEDRIADDVQVQEQEKSATLDLTVNPVQVPSDYLSPRVLYLDTSNNRQRLDYLSPSAYWAKSPEVGNVNPGLPRWFTVEGQTITWTPEIGDTDSLTATLVYFARYATLANDEDTNWLLQNRYGCYLYGALLEAEPYVGNDPRMMTWAAMYDEAVDKLNKTNRRGRFFMGNKTATARSVYPDIRQ